MSIRLLDSELDPHLRLSDLAVSPLDALRTTQAYLTDLTTPTLRLGVTGLSRAGKTVFITALVRNLTRGGRLPFLSAHAEGRIKRTFLEPQPDDEVPRFDFERHVAALTAPEPDWPDSTRAISELRLTIEFESTSLLARAVGHRRLHVDIVDYPGEWLLDLQMLRQSYAEWSADSIALANAPARKDTAQPWLDELGKLDANGPADEVRAIAAAEIFTSYLRAARAADPALSTVGPGRFLMPGDREGSPLLHFVPLEIAGGNAIAPGSLAAMMARRFESYKTHVVKPFFRDHFSRLDRQIVLVDVLAALNHGAHAIDDLTTALESALAAFRPGGRTWLTALFGSRIDRIVFAATKADHLPQSSHDRLEAVLRLIVDGAAKRAEAAGADIKVMALAALRATKEAEVRHGGELLSCIKGVPIAGQRIGNRVLDGKTEVAVFPGDLDADPRKALAEAREKADGEAQPGVNVVRFRPPPLAADDHRATATAPAWPHVRLDRALEHLIGDRLS
jgi:predicted YcjX-like family ATPase